MIAISRRFLGILSVCTCLAFAIAARPTQAAKPDKAAKSDKSSAKSAELERNLRMAQILLDAGDNTDALKEAQEALKIDKTNIQARRILVAALARDHKYDDALIALASLAPDLPGDVWVAAVQAEVLSAKGDKPKALQALEKLCEFPQAPPLAHFAAAQLLDALRVQGDGTATPRERAHLAAFLGAPTSRGTPQAQIAERWVVEIDFGPVGKAFWQAREAYFTAFRTGGAVSTTYLNNAEEGMKLVMLTPGAPKLIVDAAHTFLGMCYSSVKSKHYDLVKAEAELRMAPGNAEAQFALGRLYRDSERLPEAATALQKALEIIPAFPEALYQLGVVYKALERRADAIAAFERTVRMNPAHPAATKALSELQALVPNSPVVAQYSSRVDSPPDADLFSTERYKAGIQAVERDLLGGVEEGGEVIWLEKMMRTLVEKNDLPERVPFRVKVGKTSIVNAFATPNGTMYVTRGFLAHLKKRWPDVALDEHNSYMAGVMAHELAHVVKGHILNRELFRKALEQKGTDMDATLFRLTTRLNEIEADHEGFLWMLAAGYNPNAMVEWMEVAAADLGDPPPMEDHPTFDERVGFLLDFWTNDVRFAWQAFETGTHALQEGQALEHKDLAQARQQYELAAGELDRYVRFFRGSKEAWNNLAVAQAKLGVTDLSDQSPLARWYTPMSIERTVALKLPKIARKRRGKDEVFLARAEASLQKALQLDAKYAPGLVNLAAVQIGLKENDAAQKTLLAAKSAGAEPVMLAILNGVLAAETGKTDAAIAAFAEASKDGDPRSLYCLALAKQQKGDGPGAKTAYQAFLAKEDQGSPWANLARQGVSAMH